MTEPGRETAGGRVVLLMLVGLAVLLGGGYVAAYVAAGDNLPRGSTIEGVDVGGRDQDAAVRALQDGLADRAAAPITVSTGGTTETVSPQTAGLAVDYAASVAAAAGEQSWQPGRLWNHFTGGDDLDAVVTVDEAALAPTIERLAASSGTRPRDGDIVFRGSRVKVVEPRTGEQIDADEARTALEAAYLEEGATAELTLTPAPPDIDSGDVQQALRGFANPAVSAAVTLIFDDSRIRLMPRDFGPALGVRAKGGRLVPELDKDMLIALVDEAVSTDGAPVDATVRIVGGEPRVIPARPGVSYEPDDVSEAFLELVRKPEGKRQQKVKATVATADFTTRDARRLQITERVSTFTTYFPHADYRNTNIGRAAELVNGTILAPGEQFSLNDTVGERTRANGFTEGFIISDGVFKEDLGGGVSQMATTTFNAMFFAGLKDIEHKPHSFYIDRYPVGREATVAWGSVDLSFENDTPYGVLIQADVAPSTLSTSGVVTVSMWSTKHWDITTSASDRYNFTAEQTRTLRTEDCYPNDGYGGFDVDVDRFFRNPGESELDHSETFHTRYLPADTVICKPPEN